MKRKILIFAMALSMGTNNLPIFAQERAVDIETEKTNIEANIAFMYPETINNLGQRNLKATLTGNGKNIEVPLSEMLANNQSYSSKDGVEITFETEEKDGKVTSIKFKIDGLESAEGYTLDIAGKNYLKTSVNLSTEEYSKRINISTKNNMVLGDVNGDNSIDETDIEILENNLNKENQEYDLNGDGVITIADIAIVNNNMVQVIEPAIYDTNIVTSRILERIDQQALEEAVTIIEGDITDIFTENASVTLKADEESGRVSIPLDFGDDIQEMSSISITLADGTPKENVQITVIDEFGNAVPYSDISTYATETITRNSETVVTINLGNRVAVKKVVIEVTPQEEGGYVVVDQVTFLKDVVDENVIHSTKVVNINVLEGDESVTLSWREVENVTGYKIYYGTSQDNLDKVITTDKNSIKIDGLKNLTKYYFKIVATSGDWEGEPSDIVWATPYSKSVPLKPDFVKATAGDAKIELSWGVTENATFYNIYAKKDGETEFTKVLEGITETKATVSSLENGVEYTLYVTAGNPFGESSPSNYVQAIPIKEEIIPPVLPTENRIPNSNVVSVELSHPHHYDPNLYPDGVDMNWLIDENWETSWVARAWWEANAVTFTFEEAYDMDYLIWVARLDGNYRTSLSTYTITVWHEGDNLSGEGEVVISGQSIVNRGEDNRYHVLEFPKQENVIKIKVALAQWAGSPTTVSGSEVAFYEYNDLPDRIDLLFDNSAKTQIANGVTLEQIEALEAQVNTLDGFVVNKEILLKELEMARGLLNNDTSVLGYIKDNVYSIDTQSDRDTYGKVINNFQPLGLSVNANVQVVIYADIPEGETVQLIPTQFFEEADSLSAAPITLTNGRNIITIPKIGSTNSNRGGSLYITYSGDRADEIKLQIFNTHEIPYLELYDFYDLTEDEVKEKIEKFISELEVYTASLTKRYNEEGLKVLILNICEISLPNTLLSLPANKILEGISDGTSTVEERVERVYNSVLAWEEIMEVVYKTYGIDDIENSFNSRQNIRYMQMFSNAFMYASGNHIGIGYDSVAALMKGEPVSLLNEGDTSNKLFGWGIAHEIGHVMDDLGKAEITNNIYSLMVQTYDGEANILPSRLEISNIYEKAFEKVSSGAEGLPNDVFVHLAMYWQLHLAYDDAENPLNFYNELYKKYRTDSSLNSFTDMDKFAVASSQIAEKNLTEFFTRWGVKLSNEAITAMSDFPDETRAIYYLTDESRRQRIEGNNGNENISITATAEISEENPKEIQITIEGNNDNVQGYEIIRNGKTIGFTTEKTFTDVINSANNMAFTYEVVPIDILGNVNEKVSAGEVRVSYDKTIDPGLYTIDEDGLVTFTESTIITGIKITPKDSETEIPKEGEYTVSIKVDAESDEYILAKNGDFSLNSSKEENAYVAYFGRTEDTNDKLWSYDAISAQLTGIDTDLYNVQFISYPGDNIEFLDMGIGRLAYDYVYGEDPEDVIEAGTLIITGTYRGDTTTNKIYIKGRFATGTALDEVITTEERLINGYTLMFDEIPESGKITSATTEGIFIFVPDIQKESEILGSSHEDVSILPVEIKAEMYKVANGGQYMTTDTLWISMPTDESLPTIEIK